MFTDNGNHDLERIKNEERPDQSHETPFCLPKYDRSNLLRPIRSFSFVRKVIVYVQVDCAGKKAILTVQRVLS